MDGGRKGQKKESGSEPTKSDNFSNKFILFKKTSDDGVLLFLVEKKKDERAKWIGSGESRRRQMRLEGVGSDGEVGDEARQVKIDLYRFIYS